MEGQRAARSLQSAPTISTEQQQQRDTQRLLKEQEIQNMVHMRNLKVGICSVCVKVVQGNKTTVNITSTAYIVHLLVFAEAFLWMVFSGVGP